MGEQSESRADLSALQGSGRYHVPQGELPWAVQDRRALLLHLWGTGIVSSDSTPGPADTGLDLGFQQEGLLFNNGGPPFPIGSC